jgi:CRP-like cAMP-binding protein
MQDEICQRVVSDPEVTKRSLAPGALLSPFMVDAFAVVIEGALAVEMLSGDGEPTILEVLGPGDCVPHWEESSPSRIPIAMRAMVPSLYARVPLNAFARIMRNDPALASLLGSKLAQQHTELLARVAETAQRAALQRVSAAIDYLVRKVGEKCPLAPGVRISLSQAEIARVANHTRQTANDILTQLEAAGLVHVERSMLCVLDRERVGAVAGGEDLKAAWKPAMTCKFLHPDQALTCYPLRRAASSRTKA